MTSLSSITQLYVSNYISYWEYTIKNTYKLESYTNTKTNTLFCGVFNDKDINIINKHLGLKYVLLDGRELISNIRKLNNVTLLVSHIDVFNRLLSNSIVSSLITVNFDINVNNINTNTSNNILIYNGLNKDSNSCNFYNTNMFDNINKSNIIYSNTANSINDLVKLINSCSSYVYMPNYTTLDYNINYKYLQKLERIVDLDSLYLRSLFNNSSKINIKDYKNIKDINDSKILAIKYNFEKDKVYSIKITGFTSINAGFSIYLCNKNYNIIKLVKSDLSKDYILNINYLDTSKYPDVKYIVIQNNEDISSIFSFKQINIIQVTDQDISHESKSSKILDVPDIQVYKKNIVRRYNVGCILDIFTDRCFDYELNLFRVTQDNWKDIIDNNSLDFFLFESAWHGNSSNWSNVLINYNKKDMSTLKDLINYLNLKKIRKVFYNKEDPVNFEYFKGLAGEFIKETDLVITTDAGCIDKYKKLGCKNVITMGFCCQPVIHNPVCRYNTNKDNKDNKIMFPCAYYGSKYKARCEHMCSMLDMFDNKVDIYDRQLIFNKQCYQVSGYNKVIGDFEFPEKYTKHIKGVLDYNQVLYLYKKYKYVMNANTITDSPSMFSRRVIEAGGCGACVISNSSVGMDKILENSIIDYNDKESINNLLNDDDYRKKLSSKLCKLIHKSYTYKHIVDNIADVLNLNNKREKESICCLLFGDNNTDKFKQLVGEYESIIIKDVKKDMININKNYDYYVILNSSYEYSNSKYIQDSMLAVNYTDADIFGISNKGENIFTNDLDVYKIIVKKDIIKDMLDENIISSLTSYIKDKFTGYNMYAGFN